MDQNEEVSDAVFEEIKNDESIQSNNFSKAAAVHALKLAVQEGQISHETAGRIRLEMGISQSYFTKKHTNDIARKKARKAQRVARRVNRK